MKKLISILLVAILCFISVPDTVSAAVKINKSKATVYIGSTVKLKVTGTSKYVMWQTDNKEVATVSKGTVTGIGKGTATITAVIGSGSNNQKLTCEVIVKSRLSTKVTDYEILKDEYIEVPISIKNPKNDETLLYTLESDSIVSAEWAEGEGHVLRIMPEKTGKTSIPVNLCVGDDLRDLTINEDDTLTINIVVYSDPVWISDAELEDLGVSAVWNLYTGELEFIPHSTSWLTESLYKIDTSHIPHPFEEEKVYNVDGIEFKVKNNETFFTIQCLKDKKIL